MDTEITKAISSNGANNGSTPKAVATTPLSGPKKVRRSHTPSVLSRTQAPDGHLHDPKVRRRNALGDRLPGSFAVNAAPIEEVDLAETPMAKAIAVIEQNTPLLASEMHTHWDHVLPESAQLARSVRKEEEENLANYNAMAAAHNNDIESAQAGLEVDRDAATADDRQAVVALDQPLADAHQVAARKVSEAGGTYNAANPLDETVVLRDKPVPLEALAAEQDLPMPSRASIHMATWFGWLLVVFVGLLMGISIGIIAGVCQPDPRSLCRDWPVTLVAWAVGFIVAGGGKFAVRYVWYLAGNYCYLSRPMHRWIAGLAVAILVSVFFLCCDVALEQQGLLAIKHANEILASVGHADGGSEQSNDGVMLWVAMIVSLGLIVCAAAEGYLEGRLHSIVTRLTQIQAARYKAEDAARRDASLVKEALQSIAAVGELLHRHARLTERIAQTAAPFDTEIARLEGEKKTLQEDLSDESKCRIEDADDNHQGALLKWDNLYSRARFYCEPSPRWWERFFGPRPPRRRGRDSMLKG